MGGIGGLGWPELLVVGLVVLVFFGAKRLPEMGRSLGKGLREFRGAITGVGGGNDDAAASAPKAGAVHCTHCGKALEPEARFCAGCGAEVPGARAAS